MATRSIISKSIGESASTYVGVDGELILDTVTNTLKVSDGSSAGGVALTSNVTTDLAYEIKSADFTAVTGKRYMVDTNSAEVEVTLPASPSAGDTVQFTPGEPGWGSNNNLVVVRNGSTINGSASNRTLSSNLAGGTATYIFTGSTWRERP